MRVGELIDALMRIPPHYTVHGTKNGFSGYAEDAAVVGVMIFKKSEYDPYPPDAEVGTEYALIAMED